MRGRGRYEHAKVEAVTEPSGRSSLIETGIVIMPVLGLSCSQSNFIDTYACQGYFLGSGVI